MIIRGGAAAASGAIERRAVDVAVVGDSAAAFATAYSLSRRGKKVAVVKPSPPSTSPALALPSSVPFKAPCACPLRTALAAEAAAYWRGVERAADAESRLLIAAPTLDVFLVGERGDEGSDAADTNNNATLTAAACRASGLRAALLRPEEVAARLPGGRAARIPPSAECVLSPDGGGVLALRSAREALASLLERRLMAGGGGIGGGIGGAPVLDGWRERGGGSIFELRCLYRADGRVLMLEAEQMVAVVGAGSGGGGGGDGGSSAVNNARGRLRDDYGLDLAGLSLADGAGLVGRWRAGDGTDAASGQVPVWEAFFPADSAAAAAAAAREDAGAAAAALRRWQWGMPAPFSGGTVAVGSGVSSNSGEAEDGEGLPTADIMDEEERRAAEAARRGERRALRRDLQVRAGALFRGLVAGDAGGGATPPTARLRGASLLLAESDDDDDDDQDAGGDDEDEAASAPSWRPLGGPSSSVALVPGAPGAVGFHPAFEPGRFVVVVEAASLEASAEGAGGGSMAYGGGAQLAPLLAARAVELVLSGGAGAESAAPALSPQQQQQEQQEGEGNSSPSSHHPLALDRPGLTPRALSEAVARAWDPAEARRKVGGARESAARRERQEAAAEAAEEKRRAKAE